MTSKRIIVGGLFAGIAFYLISLIIWALFKFLPVIPFSIAIPEAGLQSGWKIEHLLVSLFIGLMWGFGYMIYGKARSGGLLYGATIYLVGLLPAFVAHFVISADARMAIVYGAIASLAGALLGGKVIALIAKR